MNNYAIFKDLEDASVFITGGGSGIGASLTEGFLAQGAKVAFVQRSDCDEFLDEISSKYKYNPLFIKCDITDIDALKSAISDSATKSSSTPLKASSRIRSPVSTIEIGPPIFASGDT